MGTVNTAHDRPLNTRERVLGLLLRTMAAAEILALVGVFMPEGWMAVVHAWLGLGELAASALMLYLARTLAGLYAVHGGVVWMAGSDVRRYRGLISYLGWTGLGFAVLATVVSLRAGFPWYWTLGEGPGLGLLSAAFLVLNRR
jgi:hypothetical protein